MRHLYNGDTFQHRGRTFRFETEHDDTMGSPWDEHDGHGPVSGQRYHAFGQGSKPPKGPGDRILYWDRGHYRTYNVAEAMKIARRDGWGCGDTTHNHTSKGEKAACAVEKDFEYLRSWCENEWSYVGVVVTLLDGDGDSTNERETLWGIESNVDAYLAEVAEELADEIMSRIEVASPDILLSEN